MTRIVLLLTAIPLAAVLALVLNSLLDSRLAAIESSVRGARRSGLRRVLSIALVLVMSMATQPVLAAGSTPDADGSCTSIDCSLIVDTSRVEQLWGRSSDTGAVLVEQSRIPAAVYPELDQWNAVAGDVASEDERPRSHSVAAEELPTSRP